MIVPALLFLLARSDTSLIQSVDSFVFVNPKRVEASSQRVHVRRGGRNRHDHDERESGAKAAALAAAKEASQKSAPSSLDTNYMVYVPVLREDGQAAPKDVKVWYQYVPGLPEVENPAGASPQPSKNVQAPSTPREKVFEERDWDQALGKYKISIAQYKGWKPGYITFRIESPVVVTPSPMASKGGSVAATPEWTNLLPEDAPDEVRPRILPGLSYDLSSFMTSNPRGGTAASSPEIRLQKQFADFNIPNVPEVAQVVVGTGREDDLAGALVIETGRSSPLFGKVTVRLKIDREQLKVSGFRLRLEERTALAERFKPIQFVRGDLGKPDSQNRLLDLVYPSNGVSVIGNPEPDEGWTVSYVKLPDIPWLKEDSFQHWPEGGRPISTADFVHIDSVVGSYGQPPRNWKEDIGIEDGKFDGSYWWRYPNQGLSFRTREVLVTDNIDPKRRKYDRLAEKVEASGSGLSVAGLVPKKSTYGDLLATLGVGRTEEHFMRSYIDGALRIDPGSKIGKDPIQAIQIARPIVLLLNGLEPATPIYRRRVYVNEGEVDSTVAGVDARYVDPVTVAGTIRRELHQLGQLSVVDSKQDADFVLSWRSNGLSATEERYGIGNAGLRAKLEGRLTLHWTEQIPESELQSGSDTKSIELSIAGSAKNDVLGIGDDRKTLFAKATERAIRSIRSDIRQTIDKWNPFWTRVGDIDYSECRLKLDSGQKAGLTVGDVLVIRHFDPEAGTAAFPAEWEGKTPHPVVTRIVQFDEETSAAICTLGTLRERKDHDGDKYDEFVELEKPKRLELLRGVLSPDTKVVFAVPVFRRPPPDGDKSVRTPARWISR